MTKDLSIIHGLMTKCQPGHLGTQTPQQEVPYRQRNLIRILRLSPLPYPHTDTRTDVLS